MTLARCESALSAVNALIVGAAPGERRGWLAVEAAWLRRRAAILGTPK